MIDTVLSQVLNMVNRSRDNKQIDKNAAKDKSSNSAKHKKKAQRSRAQ